MPHAFTQAWLPRAIKPLRYGALLVAVGLSQQSNKSIHGASSIAIQSRQYIFHVDYLSLVRQCGRDQLLCDGKRIHSAIVENNAEQDTLVMNLVIQMYGKCNAPYDGRATFEGMEKRNVFTWTIMVGVYAQCSLEKEALMLFRTMEPAGITPNKVTFITVISLCATIADLAEAKLIHSQIELSPFISDVKVGNALIHMYDKCGGVEDACLVFEKMLIRNAVTWNTLIAAHAQHGRGGEALQLFQQMQSEDIFPDNVTFVNTLGVYASQTGLRECKRVHARIVVSGFEPDVVLGTAIVSMYGKCGSLACAKEMFNNIPLRNTISWNAVLAAHEENEKEVLQLFHQMLLESVIFNKVSSVSIFSACTSSEEGLREGKRLHACVFYSMFDWDSILWNALINMYGKGGNLKEALQTLEETPTRDVSSWNAVIAAHGQHNQGQEAIQFFVQMQLECLMPNMATFVSIIDACAKKAAITEGKHVHARIVSTGFNSEVVNQMLNSCENHKNVEHTQSIGNGLLPQNLESQNDADAAFAPQPTEQVEGAISNVNSSVCIHDTCIGHTVAGESKAPSAFTPLNKIESNLVVGNALVNMYGKCQSLSAAQMIFDHMPRRNVITWTAIIAAYAQQGQAGIAFRFLFQMQEEGVSPNKITFASILDAFANQAALLEGQLIHFYLSTIMYEVDTEVGNAAMSMYGKCGSLEDTHRVFERMESRNVFSWTTLISTYSHHGHGKVAYRLYLEMQRAGVIPSSVTFVSVLSACSHAGLVDEGCRCFDTLSHVYGISPTLEHYNCMVDLLARAGKLEEGIRMIHKMPMGPTVTTWMTLLGACKLHQNVEKALYVAEKLFELEPENATPYVLLYNILSAAGRRDDAEQVSEMMISKGLKNSLGRISLVVSSKVQEFLTGDRRHSLIGEMCVELESLVKRMNREGALPTKMLVSSH